MSCTESEKAQYRTELIAELVGRAGVELPELILTFSIAGQQYRLDAGKVVARSTAEEAIAALQAKHEQELAKYVELKEDLQFVERWANHHGAKATMTPEEVLSCIQHYPPIKTITKGYADGVVPATRNPYEELDQAQATIKRLRELLRRYRTEVPLGHQPHMIAHLVDDAIQAERKES